MCPRNEQELQIEKGLVDMSAEAVKSKAFQRAALKSESYRIVGLLCLLGVMLVFVIGRAILTGRYLLVAIQAAALLLVIAHEASMLRAIKRALRDDEEVSPELFVLNVLLESQVPTLALLVLIATGWFTPYQVLVAPAVLLYFLLIILSTLRLSPTLALLTGVLSTVGYLFVTFYIALEFPVVTPGSGAFPMPVYYVYAGSILTGGIIAALVAGEIRNHVSAALREAQLQNELEKVHHDLEIARSIQQQLLPTAAPQLDNFEIAGWNQPADQTGGDYFDWQALPDGRFAISLADATGHGIGPALVSTSCRAYSRASLLAGADKNGLLDRLNSLLADDLSANRFITFVIMFLDPENSDVTIMSAGHGPILWYKEKKDAIENLEAHGIPLGMIAGVPYGQASEGSLAPGDMLVVVTDGFYEWENPEGEQFGLSRLESVIRDSHESSAEEVIAKLRSAVESFCRGTEQQDDLTAVVLKRKRAA
jgi:serine phosphatase RsbU (regulator of sigma subunit)